MTYTPKEKALIERVKKEIRNWVDEDAKMLSEKIVYEDGFCVIHSLWSAYFGDIRGDDEYTYVRSFATINGKVNVSVDSKGSAEKVLSWLFKKVKKDV